ncbi:VOC family protein [Sporolactobacillus sp. CPB3-1]|uniref:VOC family protein n=1 Tax=Sporolactobacillus mangiferae TaxID=2940498 RepID=A0ABT0MF84_9BACL|nr:VOC family protein [Sporolactobacillus mangiferae]MCL1632980.1 VOC family protein [Sporolactobacillus mangiferae]
MSIRVHPYLVTNGNGQEAVKFYQEALDAEIVGVQTFGEMPPEPGFTLPEEAKNLVMHAMLKIGDSVLMLSDNFPGQPYQLGDQVTIAILLDTGDQSKKVFDQLKDGGTIIMPLQETSWSPLYGQIKDKFGITWQISTDPTH